MKKIHSVPEIWQAAILFLEDELCRIMWNIHQKEYHSPFRNYGNEFVELNEFKVKAYSWNEENQPYNFMWKDVRINWYKHAWRGLVSNVELTPNMAQEMLVECLAALAEYEKQNNNEL